MKFFHLAFLASAAASPELDESGLLQVHGAKTGQTTAMQVHGAKTGQTIAKVKAFAQFTSRHVSSLPSDAKNLDPHTVDKFALLLQSKLAQAEKQPNDVKAALLQRSMPSAGSPVAKVIDQITALPIKTQEALAYQARDSEKLKETLASLPDIPEINSLLFQVQQSVDPFDNATQTKPMQGVTVTYTDGGTCQDEAVTTKVRTTTTGWTTTTTHHNSCGTLTESVNNKTGWAHSYQYSHNGNGGDASTVTQSSFGCWDYEHSHSHEMNENGSSTSSGTESTMCNKDGRESTYSHSHSTNYSVMEGALGQKITSSSSASNTQTVDDDGDTWSHSHSTETEHQHLTGVGTESSTETSTETTVNGKVKHSHDHEANHAYDEQTGESSFDDDGDQST